MEKYSTFTNEKGEKLIPMNKISFLLEDLKNSLKIDFAMDYFTIDQNAFLKDK